MRVSAMAAVGCFALMQVGYVNLQGLCNVQGPPDPHGKKGFVGQYGYTFDYWSDAGTLNGDNDYQAGIRNLGPTPLTVDWAAADYFRRGIASGKDAPGPCGTDRNALNTSSGVIKYGPNANFNGPDAKFYTSAQPSRTARRGSPISFSVIWESILESGKRYLAAVAVSAAPRGTNTIRYTFTSKGDPIELEWPGVLTQQTLASAQRQNETFVREDRLVLRTSEPMQFDVLGDGESIATLSAPLSVYMPNGLLLYKDRHPGLILVRGIGR